MINPVVIHKHKILSDSELHKLVNEVNGCCQNDFYGGFRIGEILHDIFYYIGSKKLYQFPGVVACDPLLERIFNVKTFSVDQIQALVLPHLYTYRCFSLTGKAVEMLMREIEQMAIESIIKKQNDL